MLHWFVEHAGDFYTQLQNFTPILVRKKIGMDMYYKLCDELKRTLAQLAGQTTTDTTNIRDKFKLCARLSHVNNILQMAGKILKHSIKTNTAVVSSLDVATNIANIGSYIGTYRVFRTHPNQSALLAEITDNVACDQLDAAKTLYRKYKHADMWARLLAKCQNRKLLELAKDDALVLQDLPDVMMTNWFEQMPQMFVRRISEYCDMDINAVCRQNRLAPHIISVSNFKPTDTEYILPTHGIIQSLLQVSESNPES